jgi:hypothetical protein
MDKLIKQSKIWELMELKEKGKLKPFSFQCAKKNGELVNYTNATLSSIHSKGSTVNIFVDGNLLKPKSFRKILITRFNEFKVYI